MLSHCFSDVGKAAPVVLEVQQPCLSQKHRKKERCNFQPPYATTTGVCYQYACVQLRVCVCVCVCACVVLGGWGLRGPAPAMPLYQGSL